jgi:hypothetical protein
MARLISIDLGAYAVKVAVSTGGAQGHALEDEVVRRVAQDGTELPSLGDRLATLDMILRDHPEWRDAHLTEVSWSSARTSVRRLKLPFTEAAQIAQTLPFAIESEVPFDLDEMLLAWRAAGEPGEVLAVVTPRGPVQDLLAALESRSLDPRRLVPDGELLARYAQYADTVTAIVDIGHAHTMVTVARGGQAVWFRSLDVAGRSFTRAVQVALDCTWAEAEALKHGELDLEESQTQPAVNQAEVSDRRRAMPEQATAALSGIAGLLLAEVRSTLVQAEDELGLEIEELVLAGGGSRLPDLARWLSEDLGLTSKAPTLAGGERIVGEMAVARALLADLAEVGEPARLDLRTGDFAFQGAFDTPSLLFRYGGTFLGTFLVAVITLFVLQYRQLGLEQDLVDARIREVAVASGVELPDDIDSTKTVTLLAELVTQMDEEAKFLPEPGRAPPTVHEVFKISKAFPPHPDVTVNVDRLEITSGSIYITGTTENFSQVDDITNGLKNAGHYNNVTSEPGNKDAKGKLQFTVSIDRSAEDDEGEDGEDEGSSGEEG